MNPRQSLQILIFLASLLLVGAAHAQVFDWKDPRQTGDRLGEFRLWLPDGLTKARAVIVLVPGYGGDGRNMTDDADWRALAQRTQCGLLACHLTGAVGRYYWQQRWSIQSLLDALKAFAAMTNHGELARAPVALWGMSAGGCFNYLFGSVNPDRTLACVINKSGGNMDSPLIQFGPRIPTMVFVGDKDTDERYHDLTMGFVIERRMGAPWSLTLEPGVGHAVASSKALGIQFIEAVIGLRISDDGSIKDVNQADGWLGSLQTHAIEPAEGASVPDLSLTSWLPSQAVAQSWQTVVSGSAAH